MLNRIIHYCLTLFLMLNLISCVSQPDDLNLLLSYMTGSFSSQEQAQADTSFKDIRLEMVQIWKNQTDGYWLYVEQAAAEKLDKPYRQRVYHLTQLNDSTFKSAVYTLANPMRFVGAWKEENPLASLTPNSLTERAGCAVLLTKQSGDIFIGVSESLSCDSDLYGAIYATSVVMIQKNQIYSWDRGFNINGDQTWGSRAGGYVFKKIK